MTNFSLLQAFAGLRALLKALGGTPAEGSKSSQRKLAEHQRRQALTGSISARDQMRRLQRVRRYLRSRPGVRIKDMPGHIREKAGV